ncbi:MAG: hypothetical protein MJK15_04975 [Colwellia sp.]|nr:hypothetical protein [Colwellia sp.]
MKYRKKPVEIEAIRLLPNQKSIREVLNFKGEPVVTKCNTAIDAFESYCNYRIDDGFINIDTLEGVMKANFGDYIIKGVKGEFYPCKPGIFELTYDKV